MREAIFILLVVFVLLGLTAYRYRKQIRFALELWRTMKSVRQMQSQQPGALEKEPVAKGNLVNCSKCGTWVPESRAIKFGPTIYYCSTKCLQNKARV